MVQKWLDLMSHCQVVNSTKEWDTKWDVNKDFACNVTPKMEMGTTPAVHEDREAMEIAIEDWKREVNAQPEEEEED